MSANPWLDDVPRKPNRWLDDDDDDEEFDPNKDYLGQVVKQKETDMVESTKRSLMMIHESEQIGAATGEELIRQGEALKRTEKRVDQMENDLKESDRHIASIKSVWGAFMNKFRKEPTPPAKPQNNYEDSNTTSRLESAVVSSKMATYDEEFSDHPVLQRQDEDKKLYTTSATTRKSERMAQVDENLDQLSAGLSRLKNIGIGLGEEIDSQDKILTRIGEKVTKVDDKTNRTNKELMRLNR